MLIYACGENIFLIETFARYKYASAGNTVAGTLNSGINLCPILQWDHAKGICESKLSS